MINLLPKFFPRSNEDRRADLKRRLMQGEAEIGGKLFGPVPKGHRRQFFCLDERTWIWYEEWTENGQQRSITTRYDVRHGSVLKVQDGQPTQHLTPAEAKNLYKAAELYYQRVDAAYRRMLAA